MRDVITTRWPSARARFLFREVNERGHELPLASVTKDGGVEFRSDLQISVWNPGEDTSLYKRVKPGDFVIGLRSFQSGIGHSSIEGLVSPAYTVLRTTAPKIHHPYVRHLFKSDVFISRLENVAQGIRQGRTISTFDFHELPLPMPPFLVQRAIAGFLDAETARIDALIAKKQRLQVLLAGRWKAKVERITSNGVPVRVRRVTSLITSGPRGWAERAGDVGEPFVRSANLQPSSLDLRTDNLAGVRADGSEAQRCRTYAGDTVMGITGANTGWVGFVTASHAGYVSQHVAILRPAGIEPRWLAYSLFAQRAQEQLLAGQYGGTKQQLGLDDLAELTLHLPSRPEQRRLCAELDHGALRTAALGASLHRQIALLQERRQALITAAVTGELDIGGPR